MFRLKVNALVTVFAIAAFVGVSYAKPLSAQETAECKRQMEAIFRTDIDCIVKYKLDSDQRQRLTQETQGIATDMECAIPLRFHKRQVYGEFVTENRIFIPDVAVNCNIQSLDGDSLPISTSFKPNCERNGQQWSCSIGMHNTQGLGVLGRGLESFINSNDKIIEEMAKAVATLR